MSKTSPGGDWEVDTTIEYRRLVDLRDALDYLIRDAKRERTEVNRLIAWSHSKGATEPPTVHRST